MRAMILAAGLGTRLRPLTAYRAKPALPVRGRPVISLLLELLARHDVEHVLVNLHHLPATIRKAVESDRPAGVRITWSQEPSPLGTGGGIKRAAEFLSASPECVVLAGDMLLDLDLGSLLEKHREAHRQDGREVTLILRDDPRGLDFGTIGLDERGGLTRIGRQNARRQRPGSATKASLRACVSSRAARSRTGPRAPRRTTPSRICATGSHHGSSAAACASAPRSSLRAIRSGSPSERPTSISRVNLEPPELPSIGGAVTAWGGAVRPVEAPAGSVIACSAEVPPDALFERCVVWDHERVTGRLPRLRRRVCWPFHSPLSRIREREPRVSEVVFIGTSDAFGAGGRRQSAVFARGERGGMLFDCGATTNTGLAQLELSRDEIDVILISHFHGDHFGGIPAFLYAALYTDAPQHPLQIVGPPDVERRVHEPGDRDRLPPRRSRVELPDPISRAAGPRDASRPDRPRSKPSRPDISPRHIRRATASGWDASASPTPATRAGSKTSARQVAASDLFICECTLHRADLDFHLSLEELREHRDDLDCGRMILTHLGEEMSGERGQIEIETADDGMAVKL